MKLIDFINRYNGQKVDFDGAFQNQCVDLIKFYFKELGLFIPFGNANTYANNAKNGINFIKNTPTGVPKPGDVIVWGLKYGPNGHVGIFVEGDAKKFRSLDQNHRGKLDPVQIVDHTYRGVEGWLDTSKYLSVDAPAPQDPCLPIKNDLQAVIRERDEARVIVAQKDSLIEDLNRQARCEAYKGQIENDRKTIDWQSEHLVKINSALNLVWAMVKPSRPQPKNQIDIVNEIGDYINHLETELGYLRNCDAERVSSKEKALLNMYRKVISFFERRK